LTPALSAGLGQPVVVDNRVGAAGLIAMQEAARASPDGYTLHLATMTDVLREFGSSAPITIARNFLPVTRLVLSSYVIVVHPSVPAGSLKELIDLAKARPGVITHASTGPGGAATLAAALFKHTAGIQMLEVPYKSFGAEIPDLMAGHVQVAFEAIAVVGQHIRSGKLRALAVTQARRNSMLPDVPTTTEGGVPGVEATTFSGILTVAGTPAAIVATLHQQFVRALNTPEFREYAAANGTSIGGEPPEEFAAFLSAESAKWGRLIKASGIRME
jgi:tripartite-type tricarboxylate transporter receptor subunit TctC